jgi:hypothetical protein
MVGHPHQARQAHPLASYVGTMLGQIWHRVVLFCYYSGVVGNQGYTHTLGFISFVTL